MILINHLGFLRRSLNGEECIDFIMPKQLEKIFHVTLYLKNQINNIAEGKQEVVWKNMSHNFNNAKLVAPVQVHETNIIKAEYKNALPFKPYADGIFIDENSECYSSLRFADCAPVVIAGTEPQPWMFFLHSGFWGTVRNICSSAIDFIHVEHENFKMTTSSWAWIGPSICKNCYSRNINENKIVSAIETFDKNNIKINGETVYFDIVQQIKKQLIKCGLISNNIYIYDECTSCKSELYYSYRAGDKKSRLFLLGNCATKKYV